MKNPMPIHAILRSAMTPAVALPLLASSAAGVVLSFAVPLTILQVYDRIIAYQSIPTLVWLSLGCIIALSLNFFLDIGRSALGAWTASRFALRTDRNLMNRILDANPAVVAKEGAERHLERLRTVSPIAQTIIVRALPTLVDLPFAAVYMAILIFIGSTAAVPAILCAAIEIAIMLTLRKPMHRAAVQAEKAERTRVAWIIYALERIHFIKAQALENHVFRDFEGAQSSELSARERKMALNRRLDEVGRMISMLNTFGTILWGGTLVASGTMTVGAVSACLFFSSRLVGIARDTRRAAFALTETLADLEELNRGLSFPSRPNAAEPALPVSIEGRLEFASVSYAGSFKDFSFLARPGAAVVLSAGGGTGREYLSELCRLAAGVMLPDEGTVLLDAYPSDRWNFLGSGGTVSYVSNRSGLLPGTIVDNIACFDPSRREAALDIAQVFGLDKIVSRLARGFESEIGPKDSGGLTASALRLVTIARALALRPRVLVWDMADQDLDMESRQLVKGILERLAGATTLILNTLDPGLLSLGTAIVEPRLP